MTHDHDVGTRQQIGNCPDGFHQNAAFFRIAQDRRFLGGLFGFFALPDLVAQVVDDGQLEFIISLGHGRHAKPFHNRIGIFQPVAQPTGGGIDDDLLRIHSQVFQQDVDLLGKVDVDGG